MMAICGVDISKDWLDAWLAPEERYGRFANSPEGVAELAQACHAAGIELAVMEASGGYERVAFLGLWQLGLPCAIANARAVRDFSLWLKFILSARPAGSRRAKAMGYMEKTDRIDARMISGFAAAKRIVSCPPPSEDQRRINALAARMRQIGGDLTIQKQRLASARDAATRADLAEIIALLVRQRKVVIAAIAAMIEADPLWQALDRTFRSVKGVAERTVATLLAELPEIGTLSNKAISKLVGLAPLADDSGRRSGKRSVRGGRATVRSILFLVADIARKFDPSLTEFRQRLLDSGKPKMVVRIALAHKLLVRLNAKARDTRQKMAISA